MRGAGGGVIKAVSSTPQTGKKPSPSNSQAASSLPPPLRKSESLVENALNETIAPGLLQLPWAGDVQPPDTITLKELAKESGTFQNREDFAWEMKHRFSELPASFQRLARAAGELGGAGKDHGSVTVANVPFRALRIRPRGCLTKTISSRDASVFSQPSFWTPTLVGQSTPSRPSQRGAIHSCLSAANDADRLARYL
jgi:hypothetical protein